MSALSNLYKITKYACGNKLVHNSYTWMFAVEHSAEHYGQLVQVAHILGLLDRAPSGQEVNIGS